MFTDIKDFTLLTEKVGDIKSNHIRKEHDKLFINIITRYKKGEIIKHSGDSFFAIFSEPSEAVKCGLEFQQSLSNNSVLKEYNLEVRIGIHLGQVSYDDTINKDLFGSQINKASRIMSISHAGQVLVSQAVWESASNFLKEINNQEIKYSKFGSIKLKGIKEPIYIYDFYFSNTGSRGIPVIISKQKKNKISNYILIFFIIIISTFYIGNYYGLWDKIFLGFSIDNPNKIKRLYVPNIVSNEDDVIQFSKNVNQMNAIFKPFSSESMEILISKDSTYYEPISDSLRIEISKNMIHPIISFVDPDYLVVTEDEIEQEFANRGESYPLIDTYRHKDLEKILDRMNCSAGLYIRIYKEVRTDNKITYAISIHHRLTKGYSSIEININQEDIINQIIYGSNLHNWRGQRGSTYIGEVLSINNESIIISIDKKKNHRQGMSFYLVRLYRTNTNETFLGSDVDTSKMIRDFQLAENYFGNYENWLRAFSDNGQYSDDDSWSPEAYDSMIEQNKMISNKNPDRVAFQVGFVLGINCKIIELFDSTAIVRIVDKDYPWIHPQIGDNVYEKTYPKSSTHK